MSAEAITTRALRPARIWAVAYRDLRHGSGGRGRLRLAALGLALLLPLAALPSPEVWPQGEPPDEYARTQPYVSAASELPAFLRSAVRLHPDSRVHVADGEPIVVTGPFVEPELRRALDRAIGDDSIAVRKFKPQIVLPGRSILIALLAVSLLLGPLAESLPGERSRRTLEVLLSAGVSRRVGSRNWLTRIWGCPYGRRRVAAGLRSRGARTALS